MRPPRLVLTGSSCILALVAASCSAPHAARPRPFQGTMIAPSGIEGVGFRFDEAGTARLVDGREEVRWPLPPGAGRPAAIACDTQGGLAVVACEAALGLLQLGMELEPEWTSPAPWSETPEAFSVRGETAAGLAGEVVTLYDLRTREQAQAITSIDTAQLELPFEDLLLALPAAESPREHITLVGWQRDGRHGRVHIVDLQRSESGWSVLKASEVSGYTYLQVCSANGSALVLAGVHEEQDRGSAVGGGFMSLNQTLLVDHVDLESHAARRLVRADQHALETEVEAVALGDGLVAVSRSDDSLTVYDTTTGALRLARQFAQAPRAAWIAPRQLLVATDSLETLDF